MKVSSSIRQLLIAMAISCAAFILVLCYIDFLDATSSTYVKSSDALETQAFNVYEQCIYDDLSQETDDEFSQENYTDEEVNTIAKMLYGECRGVKSYEEKCACVWVVLNRHDRSNKSIVDVVTAPHQFYGYDEENPVLPELVDLTKDVLDRYFSCGYRDIPQDFLYFTGDGKVNHFRNCDNEYWNFETKSVERR